MFQFTAFKLLLSLCSNHKKSRPELTERIYIDTSVVGGIYDKEFDVFTKMFFDKAFRGEIRLIISELLEEELINAPEQIKDFFRTLPANQLESVSF